MVGKVGHTRQSRQVQLWNQPGKSGAGLGDPLGIRWGSVGDPRGILSKNGDPHLGGPSSNGGSSVTTEPFYKIKKGDWMSKMGSGC